jgi:hypothetical protein
MVPCPDCKDSPDFWQCVMCDGKREIDPLADFATLRATMSSTLLALMLVFDNCERVLGMSTIELDDVKSILARLMKDIDATDRSVWGGTYDAIRNAMASAPSAKELDLRTSTDFLAGLYCGACLMATKRGDERLAARLSDRARKMPVSRYVAKHCGKWFTDLTNFIYDGDKVS